MFYENMFLYIFGYMCIYIVEKGWNIIWFVLCCYSKIFEIECFIRERGLIWFMIKEFKKFKFGLFCEGFILG